MHSTTHVEVDVDVAVGLVAVGLVAVVAVVPSSSSASITCFTSVTYSNVCNIILRIINFMVVVDEGHVSHAPVRRMYTTPGWGWGWNGNAKHQQQEQ